MRSWRTSRCWPLSGSLRSRASWQPVSVRGSHGQLPVHIAAVWWTLTKALRADRCAAPPSDSRSTPQPASRRVGARGSNGYADGIIEAAARLSGACIVMDEGVRAARRVLHESPCPVWYVPRSPHRTSAAV